LPNGREQVPELPLRGMLSSLGTDQAVVLCRLGTPVHLRPDSILFNEGDVSGKVALILSGRIKACTRTEEGREVVFGVMGAGDVIGELSAIDGRPHSATATVVETADVLVIPAVDFKAYVEAHPQMALLLVKILGERLRDADRRRVEFGKHDAEETPTR
jgi:CRP/FNR family cyclic AMP-dependent transcriptional regulator